MPLLVYIVPVTPMFPLTTNVFPPGVELLKNAEPNCALPYTPPTTILLPLVVSIGVIL